MALYTVAKSSANGQDAWKDLKSSSPEMMMAEVDPSSFTSGREGLELPNDMAEWSPDEVAAYTALRSKRKKCCIGGCTHRSLPIARSYHQLPVRNKEVWAKWIEVVRWSRNEPDWTPNVDAAPLVCSRHFSDSDFISYEASSRVRLSHTAIPVYYVDPPEGTVMDTRFSSPLPIPPMLPGPRQKDTPKSKTAKLQEQAYYSEEEMDGNKSNEDIVPNSLLSRYTDNLSYDIEEVTGENVEDNADDDHFHNDSIPNKFPHVSVSAVYSGVGNNGHANGLHNVRNSAQSLSTSITRSRNLKYVRSASKPPALIRANFFPMKDNATLHSLTTKLPERANTNGNINNFKVKPAPPIPIVNHKTPPTKHKIGLAKCRLIVQTLENQLKIAKMRLAEQLEVPYQVVHGVWNMKDSLKDKL